MLTPEEIAETVQRIAVQVARHGTVTQRDDFLAEALTLLFEPRSETVPRISRYSPDLGPLDRWLGVTLKNLWRSHLRGSRRRPTAMDPTTVSSYPDRSVPWDRAVDHLGTRFSAADHDRIASWSPVVRIELLSVSGLHVKFENDMDRGTWEKFLREAEPSYRRELPRPFPPAEAIANGCKGPGDRIGWIARALGMLPNTLSQRWKRKQSLLETLDFIRDLRGSAADRSAHS